MLKQAGPVKVDRESDDRAGRYLVMVRVINNCGRERINTCSSTLYMHMYIHVYLHVHVSVIGAHKSGLG